MEPLFFWILSSPVGFYVTIVIAVSKSLARDSKISTLYLVRKVLFSRSCFVLPRPNPCFLFSFSASFAPACLSHEIITRKWVLLQILWKVNRESVGELTSSDSLTPLIQSVPFVFSVTGQTSRWRGHRYPVPCTVGIGAYMRATKMGRPLWKAAQFIWLTAVRGLTATPRAPLSGTSLQGRRWTWSSSSCTWVLMFRRWHSNRAWSPVNFWGCSAVVTRKGSSEGQRD